MWCRQLALAAAVLCVCLLHQAQGQHSSSHNRYCGAQLADILSQLCMGKYNGKIHKKSYEIARGQEYEYAPQQQFLSDTRPQFPFRTRAKARMMLPSTFKRYVRGVSDECCKKSCTISELLSYCEDPLPALAPIY